MFTGIVEDLGTVESLTRGADFAALAVSSNVVVTDRTLLGESIAVNGVCLTVTSIHGTTFTADVMHETLRRSSLGLLRRGSPVNVERAMPADGRFSGHIVSGHIDGTGIVRAIVRDGIATVYTIDAPHNLMRFIAEKGSIAVEGISLTVTFADDRSFGVSIIPHTAGHTVLPERKVGDIVNLEIDPIARYVDRLLSMPRIENDADTPKASRSSITEDFLLSRGF
ncbi:riboflavin synthase [Bifidobacterium callimiconis]|uniref:Riboflavin synthase n=1 Tax=Bifidobacterium callimiconis TaxID=2306973 RepID=A0A430FI08_9BIFI|nr:riboflavin synthase [Bifidobacterium callimiconis]MBT1176418.1 riboflavin synthase [Bifidobacterium callimiconis]RSX52457.1 riboflavin synthase subunit alpha [Bifidobacterium callimiconis]